MAVNYAPLFAFQFVFRLSMCRRRKFGIFITRNFCDIFFIWFVVVHKENVEKLETEAKEKHDKEWEGNDPKVENFKHA